ncbi:M23 family metallopeptidase [Pleurocapsales cyanobacterium LEGE 06147]|nr:M23 family metallopeptidase [Pleurocapsales cyanobacterium LEGE 06147]
MISILSTLLITGTASLSAERAIATSGLAKVTLNNISAQNSLSCQPVSQKDDCRSTSLPFMIHLGLNSSLITQVASLILPQWRFSWQEILAQNQLTSDTALNITRRQHQPISLEHSSLQQIPPISRSSLIVPPPNDSFCPESVEIGSNCKEDTAAYLSFAHPAPETTKITSPFGWRIRPYSGQLQFHHGIDYKAPLGSPVVAARDGIVIKVVSECIDFGDKGCGGQYGNWIEIDHGNGEIAIYAHLLDRSITVKEGMKVRKNQEIAKVGSSGWSTGPHLDFRIRINGEYRDPADFIQ